MKQADDSIEITRAFMELSSENRDYVLAIVRALNFAQKNASAQPPQPKQGADKGA